LGLYSVFTVVRSLTLILRRFREMGLLLNTKRPYLEFLVICIKVFNFKSSKHFHRIYVIDLNFAKTYRNGLPLKL